MLKLSTVKALILGTGMMLSLTASCAEANEVANLQSQIDAFRQSPPDEYPIPATTVAQLMSIQDELTPAKSEKRFVRGPSTHNAFCTETEIQIYYKLDEVSPSESFTAILRRPYGHGPFPVIVMQPTLAGPGPLENKGIAIPLCQNGFASIVPTTTSLDLPPKLPDLEAYDHNLRIEMIRARRMVDVVTSDPTLSSQQVGVIGFSRGGIAGALLIGIEPRVKFAFLGAGGVGLGRIIARSQTEKGKADNAAQIAALSAQRGAPVSADDFEGMLVHTVRYDGILFAHRFDPRRLKMMIVENDDNVSTDNQRMMLSVFCHDGVCPETVIGQPDTLPEDWTGLGKISGDRLGTHVAAIVNLVFIRPAEFIEFFKTQSSQSPNLKESLTGP